eukprot:m.3619 g.3619  ORF g.3619 m.3619 type:complete len:155 (-) comp2098_c0_seq1:751-1215(-)
MERMNEKLEATLNENKARDLKNGNPDILYHGADKIDYSTTLHSEFETKKEDTSVEKGVRQRLREQRAQERAMRKLADTDREMLKRSQGLEKGDDPLSNGTNTGRLVSSKEYLASQFKPKGDVAYNEDTTVTFWGKEGQQSFGKTLSITKGEDEN